MIDIREKNSELEEFLKGLNPKEELVAKTIIITKFLYGKSYRAKEKEVKDALTEAAEGMRTFTRKYSKELEIPEEQVRNLEKEIYRLEKSM